MTEIISYEMTTLMGPRHSMCLVEVVLSEFIVQSLVSSVGRALDF